MEWRALPAVRGLHLDQPLAPVSFETGDVITRAIAILFRNPANLPRKVWSTAAVQRRALVIQNQCFAGFPQRTIAGIPLRRIVSAGDSSVTVFKPSWHTRRWSAKGDTTTLISSTQYPEIYYWS